MKAIEPGEVFARDFQIVRPLGSGGMGAVYVALQLSTRKQRALKVMLPQLLADPAQLRRFEQEARVGASIESDHVVEVVASGIDESTQMPWIAMELVVGSDLGAIVTTQGPRPLPEVRRIMRQLCHAVGAAHVAGVIHRDLKPQNILLGQSRRAGESSVVKVLDFGIARIAAEAASKNTAAMGSPLWMAPEQTERAVISPAVDVWAIGLIVFYLLTGKSFWLSATNEQASIAQLMREIILEPMPSASVRARELGVEALLPPGFDVWFERATQRDPSKRVQNGHAALEQFEACFPASEAIPQSQVATTTPVASTHLTGARPASPPVRISATNTATSHTAPLPANAKNSLTPRLAIAAAVLVVVGASFVGVRRFYKSRTQNVVATSDPIPASVSTALAPPTSSASASTSSATLSHDPPLTTSAGIASTETPPTDSARTTSREHGTSRPHATAALDDSSSASVDSHALPQSSANQAVSGNLPFDRDAAAKVLATLDLYACTTNETPSGAVHLSVTFASDGSVSNAAVDRPPYLGTPFADCIAEKAKAQRVPPFGGGPVSVGKSFSLLSRFDSAAATRAIAAVDLGPCKPLNGPTGAGHVMLTFANDGTASATVDQPPYAGTPIARCIANRYHDVHIPAFGGPSTRVGKAFSF